MLGATLNITHKPHYPENQVFTQTAMMERFVHPITDQVGEETGARTHVCLIIKPYFYFHYIYLFFES